MNSQALPNIPLWEPTFTKELLEERARNPGAFDRGYRMQAISPGELAFPSFESCYQSGIVHGDTLRRQLPAYVGVDLASSKRPGNCIFALGLDDAGNRYPLEVRYGNWKSPETAERLAEVCTHHNVQFIQVENNAYQQSIIDWVKQEKPDFPYWMKIESFTTGKNKMDENYGLPSLEVEFHNKSWVLPSSEWTGHVSTCECDWCHWKREFTMYPKFSSSDGVMATWFARDALNKWGRVGRGMGVRVGNLNRR